MNVVNAQDRTDQPNQDQPVKIEKTAKGEAPAVVTPEAKPTEVKFEKDATGKTIDKDLNSAKPQEEITPIVKGSNGNAAVTRTDKKATPTVKKESKTDMGAVAPAAGQGKTTLKTETVQPKPNFKESKNNMGEAADSKTTMQNDEAKPKGVAHESKNNLCEAKDSKTVGQPKFGTANIDKKLKLKPKTLQENKPDAVKNSKNAINR